ncbi:putative prophage protein [Escherichia coli]|nr:putative prophage protein [Escherichia coli]
MKDLTLKFADRADFSAFMDSTGYYDDESMQDDILIDVIGNVYKETGELTEDGEPGNDSNLLIVFYVQIMPDDLVMQLHRF